MGVRRRRRPAPEPEPAPETEAEPEWEPEPVPVLDPGTAAYFQRALETLEEGLSEEELGLFVPNVLAAAVPWAAAPRGAAGRLLRRLLPRAPAPLLAPALAALARGGIHGAAARPGTARMLRAALEGVPGAMAGTPETPPETRQGPPGAVALEAALAALVASARGQLVASAQHPAAALLLRALLRALAGVQPGEGPGCNGAGLEPLGAGPDPKGAGPPLALRPLLEELAEAFEQHLPELMSPPCASLCLQEALAALHRSQSPSCARLCEALIGCLAPPSDDPAHSPLVAALEDPTRSRLAEAAMTVAGPRLLRRLFREQLQGRLQGLACHRVANHGLQRLLDHAPADVVGAALRELGPALAAPLAQGHPGVLTALAGACRRLGAHGPRAARRLLQAVDCWDPPERRRACVRPLAELRPFRDGDEEQGAELKVTSQGSLLLQHLLHLGGAGGAAVGAGLAALPPPALAALARAGPPGRGLWAALLRGPSPPARRRRLLRKLRGHLGTLALHPDGRRVLKAAWAAAPGPTRADMAAELASQLQELQRDPNGRCVAHAWSLQLFLRNRHEWLRRHGHPGITETP